MFINLQEDCLNLCLEALSCTWCTWCNLGLAAIVATMSYLKQKYSEIYSIVTLSICNAAVLRHCHFSANMSFVTLLPWVELGIWGYLEIPAGREYMVTLETKALSVCLDAKINMKDREQLSKMCLLHNLITTSGLNWVRLETSKLWQETWLFAPHLVLNTVWKSIYVTSFRDLY